MCFQLHGKVNGPLRATFQEDVPGLRCLCRNRMQWRDEFGHGGHGSYQDLGA
jgi:hypothetical protein